MQLVCGRMAEDWYESIVWEMVWENGRHRTCKQGRTRVKCKTRKQGRMRVKCKTRKQGRTRVKCKTQNGR